MPAGKFVRIFDRVTAMIPLDDDAEVRVEYGDEQFFPSTYYVAAVARDKDSIRVLIQSPATTCKARDRRSAEKMCCGAAAEVCC
jgi:hypothetical protein